MSSKDKHHEEKGKHKEDDKHEYKEDNKDKKEGQSADADDTEDKDENMADISAAIAQQLKKKPHKSILKPSSSFESVEKEKAAARAKSMKWDEMNIIATLHPADKDYGFMKIDEAPTPYEKPIEDEDEEDGGIDAQLLADKIRLGADTDPKSLTRRVSEDSSGDEDETPEERAHRKEFEMKRKAHYNEFFAAKVARKIMDDDEDEEDEEEDDEEEEEEEDCEGEDCDGKKKNAKKKKTASTGDGAGTSN